MKNMRRLLAVVMTALMMLTMLPSMVFAEAVPSGTLEGKLKVKGPVAVDTTLSADYSKVTPEGMTDDYVTFKWSRKNGEELTELGTEKTYKVTAEDLGYPIVLEITGIADKGVSGTLTATTYAAVATAEEAAAFEEAPVNEDTSAAEQTDAQESSAEETEIPTESSEEPVYEEYPQEMQNGETSDESSQSTDVPEEVTELPEESWDNTGIPEATDEGTWGTDENGEVYVINEAGTETEAVGTSKDTTEVPEEAISSAKASTEDGTGELDFGALDFGYTEVGEAQYVTVTNTGNVALNFDGIAPEHFMVQDIETTLNPGESVTLWIQPRENMEPGTYDDEITYTAAEGASASFRAKVVVADAELEETEEPADSNTSDATMEVFDENGNPVVGEAVETPAAEEPTPTAAETPAAEEPTPTEAETPTPEVTEEPAATPTEAPVEYDISAEPETLDFGSVQAGYEQQAAQTVSVVNNGSSEVTLTVSGSGSFALGTELLTVEAGAAAELTVRPADGLDAGEYIEDIYFYPGNDAAEEAVAKITARFTVTEKQVPGITADTQTYDFGSAEAGYTQAPSALTVTVTNSGNTVINLEQPTGTNFTVGALSAAVLNPGETSSFTIAPAAGLAEGQYAEDITITSKENAETSVSVSFLVSATTVKLTEIVNPAAITGVANGAEKSTAGLTLPETVTIRTTNGELKANVSWDVKGCSYDASLADAQTFTVKGTVTLPSGIENPNGINLITSVQVTVDGRSAKIANPANNQITGINSNGQYTTETKITFTAVGAGMDNTDPRTGDTRYLPLKWNVLEDRTWDQAPYTATFRMGQGGSYAVKVTFGEQKFDGTNWVSTGAQDTKQVSFTVSTAQTVTATPTPTADPNKKSAVATGDTTSIMPFVVILVLAAVCILGVVIYRKKKK